MSSVPYYLVTRGNIAISYWTEGPEKTVDGRARGYLHFSEAAVASLDLWAEAI